MVGILGKKLGMTQVYDENGKRIPVTLIETVPTEVLDVMDTKRNGYNAIQLGIGEIKKKKKNSPKKKFMREVRTKDPAIYKVGDMINLDAFAEGDFVDVEGVTKGKGFQGGMKRHGWAGGPGGHGSMFHRQVGSIQSGPRLKRVTKGHPMPGHMGNDNRTVQNLKIIKIDQEKNILAVKGPVMGHNNCYLVVKESVKKPKKRENKDAKKD